MNERFRSLVDRRLNAARWTPAHSQRVLGQIRGEIKVKKRMTFATAVLIALLVLSLTAVAVTGLIQNYLREVSDMSVEGAFHADRWDLPEKARFVEAMARAGFDLNGGLLSQVPDSRLDANTREAAADALIDARYGEAMRADTFTWIDPPDTVLGMAPEMDVIFRDAWRLENPEGSPQDEEDALARWWRQLGRLHEKEQAPVTPEILDEARIDLYAIGYLTEVMNIPLRAAEKASVVSTWQEVEQVWVSEISLRKADVGDGWTDQAYMMDYTRDAGDSYQWTTIAAKDGQHLGAGSLEDYLKRRASEPGPMLGAGQAQQKGREALIARYGITAAQAEDYFVSDRGYVLAHGDPGQPLILYRYSERSDGLDHTWRYAAAVDLITGEVRHSFSRDNWWQEFMALARDYERMSAEEWHMLMLLLGRDERGEVFWAWSTQRQFAFNQALKAGVQKRAAESGQWAEEVEWTAGQHGLPGEGELPYEDALSLARAAFLKALGTSEAGVETWHTTLSSFDVSDPAKPAWRFIIRATMKDKSGASGTGWQMYFIKLDARSGALLDSVDGMGPGGSIMGLLVPLQMLTPEQLIAAAKEALISRGLMTEERLNSLFVGEERSYAPANDPTRAIHYIGVYPQEKLRLNRWEYMVGIRALSGEVADLFTWEELRARLPEAARVYPDLSVDERHESMLWYHSDETLQDFWLWAPEQQRWFNEALKPYADQVLAREPDYHDWVIDVTRRHYGAPDGQAISEQEALRLSREAFLKDEARHGQTEPYPDVLRTYDVSDPARPLWRVIQRADQVLRQGDKETRRFAMRAYVIDALNGEIISEDNIGDRPIRSLAQWL